MLETLTVIVPVYNVENFLPTCIDSILTQTYSNLEIVIVNDGSTDKSATICDSYLTDKRVKVFHKNNEGLSSARNFGIAKSTSKYVTFIDSDDYIHPNTYKEMMNLLLENQADLVVANFLKVAETTNEITHYDEISFSILETKQAFGKFYSSESDVFTIAVNKIYTRDSLLRTPFPHGMLHEDEFTSYLHILESKKIVYISTPLYFYRQRSGSIMNRPFNIRSLDALLAFRERRDAIIQADYFDYLICDNAVLLNYVYSLNLKLILTDADLKKVRNETRRFLDDTINFDLLKIKNKIKYILIRYFSFMFSLRVKIKRNMYRSKK